MLARRSEMTAHEPSTILAYWLGPAKPAHNFFASTLGELATRFDAPIFEPHVTVYAARSGNENPAEVLSKALAGCKAFQLSVRGIRWSEEFTKSVFVRFEPNAALSWLSHALRQASVLHDEYQLDPHLSLIYKDMGRESKTDVVNSIRLPFNEVLFDCAKAVVCPTPIRSREDVEAWRVVATQSLAQ
jgi:hypothetical protein